jgi:hypothetical protein
MGSLIEELARREAAARAEADRLRARIEELAGELARAEEQVTRLAIAREEVTRVLEEPPAADPARQEDAPAARRGPASPIGAVTGRRRCVGVAAPGGLRGGRPELRLRRRERGKRRAGPETAGAGRTITRHPVGNGHQRSTAVEWPLLIACLLPVSTPAARCRA